MKKVVIIIGFLLIFFFPISTQAVGYHGIELTDEYDIPKDFAFGVSDICSGHDSFNHVSAREDGWFAVYSLYTNARENWEWVYRVRYVDIYDSNGNFVLELTFSTDLSNAIELTEDTLDIYFQTAIVSYDFESGTLSAYSIPPRATVENNLLSDLKKESFTVGQWTYSCEGGWTEYTKLLRTNGEETQVLVKYSPVNSANLYQNPWLYALMVVFFAAIIKLLHFLIKASNKA